SQRDEQVTGDDVVAADGQARDRGRPVRTGDEAQPEGGGDVVDPVRARMRRAHPPLGGRHGEESTRSPRARRGGASHRRTFPTSQGTAWAPNRSGGRRAPGGRTPRRP